MCRVWNSRVSNKRRFKRRLLTRISPCHAALCSDSGCLGAGGGGWGQVSTLREAAAVFAQTSAMLPPLHDTMMLRWVGQLLWMAVVVLAYQ